MKPGGSPGDRANESGASRSATPWRVAAGIAALAALAALAWLVTSRAVAGGASAASPDPAAGAAAAKWVKPSAADLQKRLTPLQYAVTQRDDTEPPFRNAWWDNHAAGLYVDVVSGEPLFSSLDKFESGTGWPSFTKPLEPVAVKLRTDWRAILPRTEVRSSLADSHLGHVFDDGPPPTGKRFCMNSAALRFVPADRLAAEGYGAWLSLFAAEGQGATGARPHAVESAPASIAPSAPPAVPDEFPPKPTPPDR